jgi:hypothetical protein
MPKNFGPRKILTSENIGQVTPEHIAKYEKSKSKIHKQEAIDQKELQATVERGIIEELKESKKRVLAMDEESKRLDKILEERFKKYGSYDLPDEKESKKSPLDLLKEAREDKLISKKEYDMLKDETPSKIKSRLKSLELEVSDDDEPVVRATIDKDQYNAKPKPRKKQVAVKEIGHELHTRTHKGKKEPISKEEILNYVKMF